MPELERGTANIPINSTGVRQIDNVGRKLAATGSPIRNIYTSPLRRAVASAHILAAHTGGKVVVRDGLTAWPEGGLEGQPTKTVRPTIDKLQTVDRDVIPPGLSPFDSKPALSHEQYTHKYLADGLGPILAEHEAEPYHRDLLVTHGSDIRTTKAWARAGFSPSHELDPGELLERNSKPGDTFLLHQNPGWQMHQYEPDQQDELPYGVLMVRHGETNFN